MMTISTSRRRMAALAITTALACSFAAKSTARERNSATCVEDKALGHDLEQFAETLYRTAYPEQEAPGVAIAVIRRGCDIFTHGYGFANVAAHRPITEKTRFYIASSTKAFTGLTAELLQLEGRVDLDAPLTRYVPDVHLASPLDPQLITVRQLLTHTHGIENGGPVVFRSAFTGLENSRALERALEFHPATADGTAFHYGNIGYNIAGLVIERATGRDWQRQIHDLVLEPLGMSSTGTSISRVPRNEMALPYVYNGNGYLRLPQVKTDSTMHAAGGMVSTLGDLKTWLRATMSDGNIGGKQLLPAIAFEEARKPLAKRTEPSKDEYAMTGYGLGWDIGSYRGQPVLQSQGGFSAYQTLVSYVPGADVGIVILTNEAGSGEDMMRTLAQYTYDLALQAPGGKEQWAKRMRRLPEMVQHSRERLANDVARRAARVEAPVSELKQYAGSYAAPGWESVRVTVRGGHLQIDSGALHVAAEPFNPAKGEWRVELQPGRGEVIRFTKTASRFDTLELSDVKFKRTR